MAKPIIICSTGRTGSSVISGALFYLGVHMGDRIPLPDLKQPTGYFEDVEIAEICANLIIGRITFEDWHKEMSEIFIKRSQKHEFWGFKNPTINRFLPSIAKIIDAKYIWIRRKAWPTMKSMHKHWGKSWRICYKQYKKDNNFLTEFLKDKEVLEIWHTGIYDRAELVELLIKFTGIKPTQNQIRRAIESILLPPCSVIKSTDASLWTYED